MKPNKFFRLTALGVTALVLASCNQNGQPVHQNADIKPAENKMVILPADFRLGLAVIQPPRAKDGFGDTKTQTIGALNGLGELLSQRGLNLGNVMQIRATLAPGPDGQVDFEGYVSGLDEVLKANKIGTKPASAVVAVLALPSAGQYVMLEADIAVPQKPEQASNEIAAPQTDDNPQKP